MTATIVKPEITVYGTTWCSDCKRTKGFLGEQRMPYHWIDVEENAEGLAFVEQVQNGGHSVPTVVVGGDNIFVEPTNAQLAAALGLSTRAMCTYYDVIVIGGGPAGLTTSLYTAREGLSTLVIERSGLGGQVGITEQLDNFPGFPQGLSGGEFADRLVQQVRRFDVETISAQAVREIRSEGGYQVVRTDDGTDYTARAVLIATGSRYKRLGIEGEESLIGSGIHYCATCDGPFYKGKQIAVVGGGNSAVEEGVFLTRFASHVTLLVRGDKLTASQVATEKLAEMVERGKMDVLYNTEIVSLAGEKKLASITVRDRTTNEERTLDPTPAGIFVFIGLEPNSSFVPGEVGVDPQGFILTDPSLATSVPGVFAAGDIRAGSTKQAASAVGEGATAALAIRDYLRKMG